MKNKTKALAATGVACAALAGVLVAQNQDPDTQILQAGSAREGEGTTPSPTAAPVKPGTTTPKIDDVRQKKWDKRSGRWKRHVVSVHWTPATGATSYQLTVNSKESLKTDRTKARIEVPNTTKGVTIGVTPLNEVGAGKTGYFKESAPKPPKVQTRLRRAYTWPDLCGGDPYTYGASFAMNKIPANTISRIRIGSGQWRDDKTSQDLPMNYEGKISYGVARQSKKLRLQGPWRQGTMTVTREQTDPSRWNRVPSARGGAC